MQELHKETNNNIQKVETSLDLKIDKVESSLTTKIDKVDGKVDKLQWILLTCLTAIFLKEYILAFLK